MNLILFESAEIAAPLPRSDPRAVHVIEVLRRRPGDAFDAGLVNGPRGKGMLVRVGERELELSFLWGEPPAALEPMHLLIGLPRPQTARKILQETSALGVAHLDFVVSDKGEAGYAGSTLWTTGEWRRHVMTGAAQAFDTRLPEVAVGLDLTTAVRKLPGAGCRVALDNYEATAVLGPDAIGRETRAIELPVTLAFGPERGWSTAERTLLREAGFTLAHLGTRVLRVETAVVAAVTLARSARGWLR